MKKKMTAIIAMLLCAILTITGICTDTAYAADNTVPLTIKFKGKTITFSDDATEAVEEIQLKTLKKKWGKPKVEKDDNFASYTWEKGKTVVYYSNDNYFGPTNTYVRIETTDKNATVCGMKVGMKKSKAKKIMKKLGADINKSDAHVYLPEDTHISCEFKNGKVSSLYCSIYIKGKSE